MYRHHLLKTIEKTDKEITYLDRQIKKADLEILILERQLRWVHFLHRSNIITPLQILILVFV